MMEAGGFRKLATTVALVLALASPCLASDGRASGIDLVILLDQSGSMWGHPGYHPLPNDRFAHRVGATRAILERLAADVEGTARVHRFSVVDFGDEAEVAWSNQVLRHDPSDPGALRRRLEVEMPRRVVSRPLVNTNTPEALALALAELRTMQEVEPLANRRRIVLLLTDGRPQRPPATVDQMKERTRRRVRALGAEGAELWVVALNDASDYWLEGDGAFWQQIAGDPSRTHLAERAVPDLPQGVDRMVTGWLGLETVPPVDSESGSYEAPPYLGHLAFRISFEKPRDPATVRVLGPGGRPLPRVSATGAQDPTYARFAFDDPPAGRYTVESSGGTVHVAPEPHPPTVNRLAPAGVADLDVETRVVYQLVLASGAPLALLDEWPLTVTVEVESPDGSRSDIDALYEGAGKFAGRWRPSIAGVHRLRLKARTEFQGSALDVLAGARGAESTVEVSSTRPLWLSLERPDPEAGLFITPWAREARLRLAITDGDGERVDWDEVVTDPASWLRLEMLDSSGVALGREIPVAPGDRGRFEVTVPVAPEWSGEHGLFGLGELFLRVRAAPDRLAEGWALRGLRLPPDLEDLRVGGDPMSAGPIRVRLSRLLTLAVVVTVLVVGLGAVALAAARLVPPLRIRRIDKQRRVTLRVYDVVSDPSGAMAQTFDVTGKASFRLDGRVRLTLGTDSRIANRFRLVRLESPGHARGRLSYRWVGEKKPQEIHLTAGGGPKALRMQAALGGRPVAELVEG